MRLLALLPAATMALTIQDAKTSLRAALAAHGGSTKVPEVVATVEALTALNPHKAAAREPSLLGNWTQINSPEYSGGTKADDGAVQYTLGRLSFGMFTPKDLICTLGPIRNPLTKSNSDEEGRIDYEIQIPFTIEQDVGPSLPAEMINFAVCKAESDTRLGVSFSGGLLKPAAECDRKAWHTLFAPSLALKPNKRTRLMNWMLRRTMGLEKPSQLENGDIMRYQMTKPFKGYLDLLYLDDELRITKGNRGSLVVCERV